MVGDGRTAVFDLQAAPAPPRHDGPVIDSDIHITLPALSALHPYLEARWRDYLIESGTANLETNLYPRGVDISAAPGWTPADGRPPGSDPDLLRTALLDRWGIDVGVLDCTYGIPSIHNDDWAAAMSRALNDWQLAEWLEPEPRLRGSLVVPLQNPDLAAAEIDRLGADERFVQVLLPVRSESPLGKRRYWPIYAAAERHGLAVGIYAGGMTGNPITAVGWPTYHLEDYVDLAQAFQAQVISLVTEGVFAKFPALRAVLIESGVTWLPSAMWRLDKNWKGLRREVPWVDRLPSQIVADHVRLTLQPIDGPDEPDRLWEAIGQLPGDRMLMFSSDFPHWHVYRQDEGSLSGLPEDVRSRVMAGTAAETYGLTGVVG